MRLAVTGARGFIGSSLTPALKMRGHEVVTPLRNVIDAPATYTGCATVIHLANIAHARADPQAMARVNVEGTRRVAELAAAGGVRRFIYLSSIKALGEETAAKPFDGTERPAPRDAYGRAKAAAEEALDQVAARTGMQVIVLRPPLVYGPGVKANFLALMRALGKGWPLPLAGIENRRSLIFAGNLADAIARCVEAPALSGKFLVSDGAPVSTPALCGALGDALERPVRLFAVPRLALELLPGMKALTRSLEADDSAFRRELGWRPPTSFKQAIGLTARWYRLECAA